MSFCAEHWAQLRAAVEERGLGDLVSSDGELTVAQQVNQLERAVHGEEPVTAVNYDPLMAAHWQIVNYVFRQIGDAAALYLVSPGPEDPVEGYGEGFEGRTWPRCPVCYINLAHEVSCTERRCKLDRERGYDWTIPRAADDQAARVAEMRCG